MEDRDRLLRQWSEKLLEMFELEDTEVDVAAWSAERIAVPLSAWPIPTAIPAA